MARADTRTLIPLDRVAFVLGIDPLHFNGVVSSVRPERDFCDDMWAQFDWQQHGKISRETLANVLSTAEFHVAKVLGFYPSVHWVESEEHPLTKPNRVESFNITGLGSRLTPKTIRAKWGYVVEVGQRKKDTFDLSATITYSDEDGDGYKETALVTVSDSIGISDREEIRAYYTDRNAADGWEIRPINVSLAGEYILDGNDNFITDGSGNLLVTADDTISITFRREQVVLSSLPGQLQAPDSSFRAVDGDDDANFETTVDIYRVYSDPSVQGTFSTLDLSCAVPGTIETETAALSIYDKKRGFMQYQRANWDETTEAYTSASFTLGREPDKLDVYYRAGLRFEDSDYPNTRMTPMFERMIIYYALTLIDQEICGCSNLVSHVENLRQDMAIAKNNQFVQISTDDLGNPFNTTKAGLQLWRMVKQHRLAYAR